MSLKFTIIIPCYNAERWLPESINSALAQTYDNIEVIFVDNESTDNSYQVALEIQKSHPNLKVFTAPNLYKYSWTEPVDKALSEAQGDYFTILGADDYIDKDYIKNIVNIISAAPDTIQVIQTPIRGVLKDKEQFLEEIKHTYKSLEEFKSLLFQRCPVNTPTVVYKKELYDTGIIRWNSEDYLGAADYDLYFNIAHHNIFIYPYPKWLGYFYRWHDKQATWGMHQENTNYDTIIQEHWDTIWKEKRIACLISE